MPRILIVEDDESVGDSLKRALQKAGRVLKAAGTAAVRAGIKAGKEAAKG